MKFGDIPSFKLIEDIYVNHLGYGYITYYDPESSSNAIKNCDGKSIWNNQIIEVKYFKKKNERMSTLGPQISKIYLTNLPGNFNEKEIIKLCENFGEITSCQISTETIGRIYAIVGFPKIESAEMAQKNLNGKNINGYNLFCEIYRDKKNDNSHLNINNNNFQRNHNSQINDNAYKMCNLYIKNIPYSVNEEMLNKVFSKYGEIKSTKIEMYNLATKIGDEIKAIPTSKGFGYVWFENAESAKKARDELNGKFIPGYESWKNPLIIEYLIPKSQRNFMLNQEYNNNMVYNNNNQYGNFNKFNYNQQNQNINQFGRKDYSDFNQNSNIPNNNMINNNPNNQINKDNSNTSEMIDMNYFNNIENIEDKKSYLGEIIFKQIEEHSLAQEYNMTMDTIGKITGMIINIDNINEIIETCQKKNCLLLEFMKLLIY